MTLASTCAAERCSRWPVDGRHVAAARAAGDVEIAERLTEGESGLLRLGMHGANADHGEARRDHPEVGRDA